MLFLEKSIGNLYRKILNMKEDANEHPDLFHLRPSGKARIITVEKTRSLIDGLYRTGHQSNKKVAIIHEADRMRKEAANAFLKTLEEPPAGISFSSNNKALLYLTNHSQPNYRCQT